MKQFVLKYSSLLLTVGTIAINIGVITYMYSRNNIIIHKISMEYKKQDTALVNINKKLSNAQDSIEASFNIIEQYPQIYKALPPQPPQDTLIDPLSMPPPIITPALLQGTWGICDDRQLVLPNQCTIPWTNITFQKNGVCSVLVLFDFSNAIFNGNYNVSNGLLTITPLFPNPDLKDPSFVHLQLNYIDSNNFFAIMHLNNDDKLNFLHTHADDDSRYPGYFNYHVAFKKSPKIWYSYIYKIK